MTDAIEVVDVREVPAQRRGARTGTGELALDKYPPRALLVVWPLGEVRAGLDLTAERRRQVLRLAAIVRDLLTVIKDRDVNLSALARRVGVNRSTVARILNGEQWPSFTVLEGLAHDLGVSLVPETGPIQLGLAERLRD